MSDRKTVTILVVLNIALLGVIIVQRFGGRGRPAVGDGFLVRAADARTADVFSTDPSRNPIVIAANSVSRAVVAVGGTISRITYYVDPFFEGFYWRYFARPREEQIEIPFLGSGVFIDDKGHLVTNVHVIEGVDDIFVTLNDGTRINAKLLDKDNRVDVALLKADVGKSAYAPMGNSDDLAPGEWVLAVGNPFGDAIPDPRPTVTLGVVSALHRNYKAADVAHQRIYLDMIQTDAAINPGNSGGPLVNIRGEIVGLNTFIVTNGGASVGIGFAIPINRVKAVVDEILRHGRVRNYVMDFDVLDLTPRVARWLHIPTDTKGAVVRVIYDRKGPAVKAGLQVGDIIVQADRLPITSRNDLLNYFLSLHVGAKIRFKVLRDGKEKLITYTIEEYNSSGARRSRV